MMLCKIGRRGIWGSREKRGRLPFDALGIQTNGLDFVQDLDQGLTLQRGLVEDLVLELDAVLTSSVVKACRRSAPFFLALVVEVSGHPSAILEPADAAGQQLGFFGNEVVNRRVVVGTIQIGRGKRGAWGGNGDGVAKGRAVGRRVG